jgi:hypothetical protein
MIVALLLATGCLRNACQRLCNDMQDYAKSCGYEFSPQQLQDCYENERRGNLPEGTKPSDSREVAPNLEDEWTCDEFADYFDAAPSTGDSAQ